MGENEKRKRRRRRKQQQQRNEEEEPPLTRYPLPPSPIPSASELRNWAELPELPLHSILTRLLNSNPENLPDFLSFSSVCRSWKSTSATSPTSFPPLLLLLSPENPNSRPRRSLPPPFRLQTLLTQRTFQSKIPPETLTLIRLGYSNGRLILLSRRNPIIADVFTGELTRIRPPPVGDFPHYFRIALLADQDLFLLTSKSLLLSYRPGTNSWASLATAVPSQDIVSLAFHRGKLFALDSTSRLMVVDLGGGKDEIFIGSWKLMKVAVPVEQPGLSSILLTTFDNRLFECGGELLLLRLNALMRLPPIHCRITVYSLDFERLVWVPKERLGDWCIFLDPVGHCPVVCPDPARWGGRRNCVYFAGVELNNWVMVPLNEDLVSRSTIGSLENVFNPKLGRWPTPVWVYPSMIFSDTTNS